MKANAKDQEVKCSLAPKQLLNGDGKTDLEFALKNITEKGKEGVEFTAAVRAGGYNIAGINPYSSLDFTGAWNKADGAKSFEAIWSENFKYDAFHLGFENEFDDVKDVSKD